MTASLLILPFVHSQQYYFLFCLVIVVVVVSSTFLDLFLVCECVAMVLLLISRQSFAVFVHLNL